MLCRSRTSTTWTCVSRLTVATTTRATTSRTRTWPRFASTSVRWAVVRPTPWRPYSTKRCTTSPLPSSAIHREKWRRRPCKPSTPCASESGPTRACSRRHPSFTMNSVPRKSSSPPSSPTPSFRTSSPRSPTPLPRTHPRPNSAPCYPRCSDILRSLSLARVSRRAAPSSRP